MRRNFVVLCCLFVAPAVTVGGRNGATEATGSLAREILDAHNEVRARVEVPPLRWSDRLAARAQEWANHLLLEGQFYHRPHPVFGENLLEITGARASAAEVVGDWAAEVRDYSYSANTCRRMCGHYTQLVWHGTREVGCAVASEPRHEVWVCNYDPPGNWVGERPY